MPRPKKPTVLKKLEGNPGKRELPDEPIAVGSPEKPDHVQHYATTVWNRVIASMPNQLYTAVDSELLAAYCIACAEYRTAVKHVAAEQAVLVNDKGNSYKNPWMTVMEKQSELIAKHGAALGLDPSSRAKMTMPQKQMPNKWAGLIEATA